MAKTLKDLYDWDKVDQIIEKKSTVDSMEIDLSDLQIGETFDAFATMDDSLIYTDSPSPITITTGHDTIVFDDQCDVNIPDQSISIWDLEQRISRIEDRLAILRPDPEIEGEWAELEELRMQYLKMEENIKSKLTTYKKLKDKK